MNKKSGLADSPFFAKEQERPSPSPAKAPIGVTDAPEVTQPATQKVPQISKPLSRRISKKISKLSRDNLNAEAIEQLAFQLRKTPKARINADVPQAWKTQLDNLAHELQVGKYELVMTIIKRFLDEMAADGHDEAKEPK
jgi:hypothetical protein